MTELHRALSWLHEYGRKYPGAWELYAVLQEENRNKRDWPEWCWLPSGATVAILSVPDEENRPVMPKDRITDVGIMAGLAAWRATQGIYRLHEDLLEELMETPIRGQIPSEVLVRLPEWCVYVETPNYRVAHDMDLRGFWAYVDIPPVSRPGRLDVVGGDKGELCLLLDLETPRARNIIGVGVRLGGTLEGGLSASFAEGQKLGLRDPDRNAFDKAAVRDAADAIGPLLSVLLYLCSDGAEIGDAPRSRPPRVVQGKKRPITPAAPKPIVHAAGYRIGAKIRMAREKQASEPSEPTGDTRGVTPHVRRAHWHTFWSGPRAGERRPNVKWLSPMLIGFEDDIPDAATLREVADG